MYDSEEEAYEEAKIKGKTGGGAAFKMDIKPGEIKKSDVKPMPMFDFPGLKEGA